MQNEKGSIPSIGFLLLFFLFEKKYVLTMWNQLFDRDKRLIISYITVRPALKLFN
jgi:hypothetical protein